jgi:hypothetical protein
MIRAIQIAAAVLPILIGAASAAFAQPVANDAFQLRFGGFFPAGGGDVWDENEEVFGLRASDFDGFFWGFGFEHGLSNNLEVSFNVDFYSETVRSSYRDYVDQNGRPILHDTRLSETPVYVDVRYLPTGRYKIRGPAGRRVLKPVFFIGAGLGGNFWEYREVGDFLDFTADPLQIVGGDFKDSGVAFQLQALTGVELPFSHHFTLSFEGRYTWANATLSGQFAGLGRLELGGGWVYLGTNFRF